MIRWLLICCLWIMPAWADNENGLEQAKQAMQAGHYAQALKTLESLVKQEPNNYEAWFLFGVAQVHEQQDHQAIEAFKHVIELRPNLAEPHNNLAAVYNNLGDTQAAIRELETALKKRPNYAVAEENLADLHIKLALKYYRDSLKHGANRAVEQRYARLLRVRNPAADQDTIATQHTPKKDHVPAMKPAKPDTKSVANTASPTTTAKPQAAVITPAEKTMPSIAEDKSITGVLDTLEAWRKAWSEKNLDAYFNAYAEDFKPGARFNSVDAWKAYKTRVIQNKAFIDVQLEKVEVDIPASRDMANIRMLQHYRSNTFSGDNWKTITMKYTPKGWKIIAEVSRP